MRFGLNTRVWRSTKVLILAAVVLLPGHGYARLYGPLVLRACESASREDADLISRKSETKQDAFICIVWDCRKPDIIIFKEQNPASVPMYWESKSRERCD